MGNDLPQPQGNGGLPTLGEWLENWVGFQLPSIPMPQTIKNLDKSVGRILLAAGENAEARIKSNTGKQKAKGKIEVDGMYRTEEEKRKLENRAATVKVAIDELNERPSQEDATQEIDDDWLNLYAKLAEDKSSEELRSLFGKILAGEIRNPGSFSLRTMQFISALSRDEAQKISEFFSLALSGKFVPTPRDVNSEKQPGLNARILIQELGIASSPNPLGGLQINFSINPQTRQTMGGIGYVIMIANGTDETLKLNIPCQALTKLGQELFAIAAPPTPSLEYLKEIAQLVYSNIEAARTADLHAGHIKVAVLEGLATQNGSVAGNPLYIASAPPPDSTTS